MNNEFEYIEQDGKIVLTKYCGDGGAVVIPSEIDGKPVTIIGENAFSGCNFLTSVVIPKSVTAIGDEAFRGCTSLTSVIIPEGVTKIGDGAFKGSRSLTISAPAGSKALQYAKENNIPYKIIED